MSEEQKNDQSSSVNAIDFVDDELDSTANVGALSIEAFVTLAILRVVSNPGPVTVSVVKSQRLVILEYDVDKSDVGQVIGKHGHTINAIRSLAKAAAGDSKVEYVIYVLEDGRPPAGIGRHHGGGGRW